MVEILLSVRPHWVSLILDLLKTIELRKSAPHCDFPVKVYLYETRQGRGAVVGECICFAADPVSTMEYSSVTAGSCLEYGDIVRYARGRKVYAWFLSNVVRYSKPKPLSAFGISRAPQSWQYVKGGAA